MLFGSANTRPLLDSEIMALDDAGALSAVLTYHHVHDLG